MHTKTLEITHEINLETLQAQLNEANENVIGLSQDGDAWNIYFVHEPDEQELDQVLTLVNTHDPSIKSADQRAQEALEQIRRHFIAQPLDVEEFGDDDQLLRHIAERVAWLEHEIARWVR